MRRCASANRYQIPRTSRQLISTCSAKNHSDVRYLWIISAALRMSSGVGCTWRPVYIHYTCRGKTSMWTQISEQGPSISYPLFRCSRMHLKSADSVHNWRISWYFSWPLLKTETVTKDTKEKNIREKLITYPYSARLYSPAIQGLRVPWRFGRDRRNISHFQWQICISL